MKRWFMLLAFCVLPIQAQQVIAQDSKGMIVEVKEKYGGLLIDTCTVLMLSNNQFVLVKREGTTGWFPTAFHSVRVVEKFSDRSEQLAERVEKLFEPGEDLAASLIIEKNEKFK